MFLLVIRLVAPVDLATCSRVLFLPATLEERSTGFKTTGLADVVGCFSIGISLSGGVSVAVSSGDRSRHLSVERSVAVLSSDTGGDWSVERSVAVLSSDTGGDWSAGRSVAVLSSDTGGDWSAGRSVAVLSSDTGGDWSAVDMLLLTMCSPYLFCKEDKTGICLQLPGIELWYSLMYPRQNAGHVLFCETFALSNSPSNSFRALLCCRF